MSEESSRRGAGFNRRFVAAAEAHLEPEVFARLIKLVEEELRQPPTTAAARYQPEAVPVPQEITRKADKAAVMETIAAALNERPVKKVQQHAVQRMEERLGIEVGPHEVAELTQFILRGGANVTKLKREVRSVDHYRVIWRGCEFVAVLAVDRRELITVRKTKKRPPKKLPIRAPREPARERASVRAVEYDEDAA